MVEYLFWTGALVLLALVLAGDYILTRFQHTRRSKRTLASEAAGSLVVGAGVAIVGFRQGVGLAGLLWTLVLAIPLFLVVAVATVEMWRRRKLAAFDNIIRQLRRDLQRRRDDLDRLIWQMRDLERRVRVAAPVGMPAPQPGVGREAEAARLRRQVQAWQGAGGLARIRALKVAEWQEEFSALPGDDRRARRKSLEAEMQGAVDERREALSVQVALVRLAELSDRESEPETPRAAAAGAGLGGADVGLEAARRRRSDEERQVARLQAELDQWQRERAAFLRQRIPLD